MKDYPGAIEDYSKAIELDPTNALAYNNRGLIKKTLENYEGAIEDYTKAIKLNESYAVAYFNRGNAKVLKDRSELACDDLKRPLTSVCSKPWNT